MMIKCNNCRDGFMISNNDFGNIQDAWRRWECVKCGKLKSLSNIYDLDLTNFSEVMLSHIWDNAIYVCREHNMIEVGIISEIISEYDHYVERLMKVWECIDCGYRQPEDEGYYRHPYSSNFSKVQIK